LPSMSGRTVAITGCSRGLGYVTALTLAKKGAQLFLLNRDSEASARALVELTAECTAAGSPMPQQIACDLLDFSSVRAAADKLSSQLAAEGLRLDVLCCNAGIMLMPDEPSKDGYDITIATNVLSHFLLARELLPALEAAASATGDARVVSMSSGSGMGPPGFDAAYFAAGSGGALGGPTGANARYHQSKLANLLFTSALDEKLRARGSRVRALACTPGVCGTDMYEHVQGVFNPGKPVDFGAVASVEDGCLGQLKCVCDPSVESGECWGPNGYSGPPVRLVIAP
ncbi:short chain dehydrogenase, partial [Emiliania huxleyi CCMP1516]